MKGRQAIFNETTWKGRHGSMIGVDRKRTSIEKRRLEWIEKQKARKVKNLEEPSVLAGVSECKYNYYGVCSLLYYGMP